MFPKLFVEITNRCNLTCDFCPPTKREGQTMPRERFALILDRLSGFGKHLYFHVKGEPLLHPELGDFLTVANERGFQVTLTTNGTLLEERCDILLDARNIRKLSVSLHSHAGTAAAEGYWRGVEAFLERHRALPAFPVSLRLWNLEGGLLPAGTERLWELLRSRYPAIGELPQTALPSSLRLDEGVWLNPAERFDWPDLGLPEDRRRSRGFCHGLGKQLGILADGTVVPCCLDGEGRLALGNILDSPLAGILASPRAMAIRTGFGKGQLVEELCQSCGYARRFRAVLHAK